MKIFKYTIHPGLVEIDLPIGAKVISIQCQKVGNGESIQLWAIVDPNVKDTERRRFYLAATGEHLPKGIGAFIETFQMPNMGLVYHAFEFNG